MRLRHRLRVSEWFGGRSTVEAGQVLTARGAPNVSVGRVDGEEDVSPIGVPKRVPQELSLINENTPSVYPTRLHTQAVPFVCPGDHER